MVTLLEEYIDQPGPAWAKIAEEIWAAATDPGRRLSYEEHSRKSLEFHKSWMGTEPHLFVDPLTTEIRLIPSPYAPVEQSPAAPEQGYGVDVHSSVRSSVLLPYQRIDTVPTEGFLPPFWQDDPVWREYLESFVEAAKGPFAPPIDVAPLYHTLFQRKVDDYGAGAGRQVIANSWANGYNAQIHRQKLFAQYGALVGLVYGNDGALHVRHIPLERVDVGVDAAKRYLAAAQLYVRRSQGLGVYFVRPNAGEVVYLATVPFEGSEELVGFNDALESLREAIEGCAPGKPLGFRQWRTAYGASRGWGQDLPHESHDAHEPLGVVPGAGEALSPQEELESWAAAARQHGLIARVARPEETTHHDAANLLGELFVDVPAGITDPDEREYRLLAFYRDAVGVRFSNTVWSRFLDLQQLYRRNVAA